MRLESTKRQSPPVSFREAIVGGIAPDGGLYLPVQWPTISAREIESWRSLSSFPEIAARIATRLLEGEFPHEVTARLTREALDIPVRVVEVVPGMFVLELFHGPTLAFKDFGARFLARFLGEILGERDDRTTILVATSGDTGSAVAHGFYNVPRVNVVVLYPAGKVSSFQESQMATLGGNVKAVRVAGTFDDCQRLVKTAFLDRDLADLRLSSANSINIGRLLPQSFYYFAAYLAVVSRIGDSVVFSVPTGNVGNLTAGVIARRLGLPVSRFVAATNLNRVLPDYMDTGSYTARPSIATRSNAMDVGDPSNFVRLLEMHGGSFEEMQRAIFATSISEEETLETIRGVYRASGHYVLDPHTAVAWAAAGRYLSSTGTKDPIVVLATAHPAKFGGAIKSAIGFEPKLPEAYEDWQKRPVVAVDLVRPDYSDFKELLLS